MSAISPASEALAAPRDGVADARAAYQWLVAACRAWLTRRTGLDAPAGTEAPREAPWSSVDTLAHVHGLAPILHDLARQGVRPASAAPRGLREKWEEAYYSTRILNAETMAVLSAILERAGAADIPMLVIKGPAVIAAVHGDVGLRPMSDLDLLCRTRDLVALSGILQALGYRPGIPYVHHLDFFRARDEHLVELHFDAHDVMAHRSRFLEGAWSTATIAALEDWRFPVMGDEHAIVFELAHCAHHDFDLALKHLVDFAGRLTAPSRTLDRTRLATMLRDARLAEAFSLMVAAVETVLGVRLPDGPAAGVSQQRIDDFVARFVEHSSSVGLVRRQRTAKGLARRRGAVQKAAFLRTRLLPPLAALQAAYGVRSRTRALGCIPAYLTRVIRDGMRRHRAGF